MEGWYALRDSNPCFRRERAAPQTATEPVPDAFGGPLVRVINKKTGAVVDGARVWLLTHEKIGPAVNARFRAARNNPMAVFEELASGAGRLCSNA